MFKQIDRDIFFKMWVGDPTGVMRSCENSVDTDLESLLFTAVDVNPTSAHTSKSLKAFRVSSDCIYQHQQPECWNRDMTYEVF